jgi:glyoxylase-like metal-dependent hydrolase (beta-lactamase superfamily II)
VKSDTEGDGKDTGRAAVEMARGLWRITTPMPFRPGEVHAYLAEAAPGRWMLVDGGLGTDAAWEALDAGVREAAGGWEAVRLIVLTHMHMDHVGLAARAAAASAAPVLTGRLDAERMAHAAAHPEEEAEYRAALLARCGAPADFVEKVESGNRAARAASAPVEIAGTLDGDEGEVPGAPGWRFAWTPGHTAGHVSLHRPEDGAVIAGDAVLPRITPTLGVNRQRADPVGDYLEALARLEALPPRLILPGHGDPPGVERIGELREAAEGETAAVEALLDGEAATVWEVVERRYAGRLLHEATRMLALRETLAHLDRLAAGGRARSEKGTDGAERFRRP